MTRKALHAARPAIAFDPVPRRPRFDGWTPKRQAEFIETLARTGSLRMAAASVNMSEAGAIWLRKQPGAESFNAAWDAAVEVGTQAIRDILVDHALNGTPEEVWSYGKHVGMRRRFNHRSMMWLVENGDKARAAQAAAVRAAEVAAGQAHDESERDRRDADRNQLLALLWAEEQVDLRADAADAASQPQLPLGP